MQPIKNWPSILAGGAVLLALGAGAAWIGTAGAAPAGAIPAAASFADPAFERVWGRTDYLVAIGQVARSWYWGPAPNSALVEPYAEGPGRVHQVQYFDKSRMEINNPSGDPNSKWYVTNGLLTIELISGRIQVGNTQWVAKAGGPAPIPLASDTDDPNAPTYASFANLANTPLGDHRVGDRTDQPVLEAVTRAGQVVAAPEKATYNVYYRHYEPATGHNIPTVFWDFLNAPGPVRENGQTLTQQLSDPWFFTSGYPISDAYWARVKIANTMHDVLIQPYERRVLTYVPDNAPAWQVQMGNIGQHYVDWRYHGSLPSPLPTAPPTVGP